MRPSALGKAETGDGGLGGQLSDEEKYRRKNLEMAVEGDDWSGEIDRQTAATVAAAAAPAATAAAASAAPAISSPIQGRSVSAVWLCELRLSASCGCSEANCDGVAECGGCRDVWEGDGAGGLGARRGGRRGMRSWRSLWRMWIASWMRHTHMHTYTSTRAHVNVRGSARQEVLSRSHIHMNPHTHAHARTCTCAHLHAAP